MFMLFIPFPQSVSTVGFRTRARYIDIIDTLQVYCNNDV